MGEVGDLRGSNADNVALFSDLGEVDLWLWNLVTNTAEIFN